MLFLLGAPNKTFMLAVIMLNVIMLNVVAPFWTAEKISPPKSRLRLVRFCIKPACFFLQTKYFLGSQKRASLMHNRTLKSRV